MKETKEPLAKFHARFEFLLQVLLFRTRKKLGVRKEYISIDRRLSHVKHSCKIDLKH